MKEWVNGVNDSVSNLIEEAWKGPVWSALPEKEREKMRFVVWCHFAAEYLWEDLMGELGISEDDFHIKRWTDALVEGRLVFYFYIVTRKGYAFFSIAQGEEPTLHLMADSRDKKDKIGQFGYTLLN